MNVCVNCKFHCNLGSGTIWYNQVCKAVSRPRVQNPVTGEMSYRAVNSLGQTYYSNQEFAYCRDVNTECECNMFSEKNSTIPKLFQLLWK